MSHESYPARSHLRWKIEYGAFRLLGGGIARLPPTLAFRAGEAVGWLCWLVMPRRRRIVARNLRIAFAGEFSEQKIRRLTIRSMVRSGANLVSSIRTARMSREELARSIEIEGLDLLEDAERTGRGLVVLLCHKGNWEVLSRMGALLRLGRPVGAYYRPLNNPLIDKAVRQTREADGTRMFSKRDSALQVSTFLKEGGLLGILADQRAGLRGEVATFFGKPTRASQLPPLLARRSGSTIVSVDMETIEPGRWRLTVKPVPGKPSTAGCLAAIEECIRSSPVDYFWLQDRWKMQVRPDIPLARWLGPKPMGARKPVRVLIWLPDAALATRLEGGWWHPDARYEVAFDPAIGSVPAGLENFPRHEVNLDGSRDRLRREFHRLDRLEAAPINLILTGRSDRDTRIAAKRELIPMVVLG